MKFYDSRTFIPGSLGLETDIHSHPHTEKARGTTGDSHLKAPDSHSHSSLGGEAETEESSSRLRGLRLSRLKTLFCLKRKMLHD